MLLLDLQQISSLHQSLKNATIVLTSNTKVQMTSKQHCVLSPHILGLLEKNQTHNFKLKKKKKLKTAKMKRISASFCGLC